MHNDTCQDPHATDHDEPAKATIVSHVPGEAARTRVCAEHARQMQAEGWIGHGEYDLEWDDTH